MNQKIIIKNYFYIEKHKKNIILTTFDNRVKS